MKTLDGIPIAREGVAFNVMARPVEMDGFAVPERFVGTFHLDGGLAAVLHCRVIESDRVVVHKVEILGTEDHPDITAADVRQLFLSHSQLRDEAIQMVAQPVESDGQQMVVRVRGDASERRGVHAANKRRGRVNQVTLERVAEIVKANPLTAGERSDKAASEAAYEAIATELDSTRRTAQLWVKRAKDAGLL